MGREKSNQKKSDKMAEKLYREAIQHLSNAANIISEIHFTDNKIVEQYLEDQKATKDYFQHIEKAADLFYKAADLKSYPYSKMAYYQAMRLINIELDFNEITAQLMESENILDTPYEITAKNPQVRYKAALLLSDEYHFLKWKENVPNSNDATQETIKSSTNKKNHKLASKLLYKVISSQKQKSTHKLNHKCIEKLIDLENQGSLDAKYYLAMAQLNGYGTRKNEKEAKERFEQLAKQEDTDACLELAKIYYKQSPQKNVDKIIKYTNIAIEAKIPESNYLYGLFLKDGYIREKNLEEALRHLQIAERHKVYGAAYQIGLILEQSKDPKKRQEGYKYFLKELENNDEENKNPEALYSLGKSLLSGDLAIAIKKTALGDKKVYATNSRLFASEFFQEAANKGHPPSMFELYKLKKDGLRKNQKLTEEDLEKLNTAANQNYSPALLELAMLHKKGQYVEKNSIKCREYLEKAAELGNEKAVFQLSLYYKKTNPEYSQKLLVKAARLGNYKSLSELEGQKQKFSKLSKKENKDVNDLKKLAYLKKYGIGTEKDEQQAAKFLRQAADAGDGDAIYELAQQETDTKKSLELLKQAAEKNNSKAQKDLAIHHLQEGKNDKAIELLETSIKNNDTEAMLIKAKLIKNQQAGLKKDEKEVFKLTRQASELGDATGFLKLAECHRDGVGTEQNALSAIECLMEAADRGNEKANKILSDQHFIKKIHPQARRKKTISFEAPRAEEEKQEEVLFPPKRKITRNKVKNIDFGEDGQNLASLIEEAKSEISVIRPKKLKIPNDRSEIANNPFSPRKGKLAPGVQEKINILKEAYAKKTNQSSLRKPGKIKSKNLTPLETNTRESRIVGKLNINKETGNEKAPPSITKKTKIKKTEPTKASHPAKTNAPEEPKNTIVEIEDEITINDFDLPSPPDSPKESSFLDINFTDSDFSSASSKKTELEPLIDFDLEQTNNNDKAEIELTKEENDKDKAYKPILDQKPEPIIIGRPERELKKRAEPQSFNEEDTQQSIERSEEKNSTNTPISPRNQPIVFDKNQENKGTSYKINYLLIFAATILLGGIAATIAGAITSWALTSMLAASLPTAAVAGGASFANEKRKENKAKTNNEHLTNQVKLNNLETKYFEQQQEIYPETGKNLPKTNLQITENKPLQESKDKSIG